jgi:hypothetical protein
MTAKTLTGTLLTIKDSDIVVVDGKPVIMFFTVDNNGQHGIFNQNELTDFVEQ